MILKFPSLRETKAEVKNFQTFVGLVVWYIALKTLNYSLLWITPSDYGLSSLLPNFTTWKGTILNFYEIAIFLSFQNGFCFPEHSGKYYIQYAKILKIGRGEMGALFLLLSTSPQVTNHWEDLCPLLRAIHLRSPFLQFVPTRGIFLSLADTHHVMCCW